MLLAGTMRLPYPSLEQVLKRLEKSEGIIRLAADVDGVLAGFLELETYPGNPAHSHAADIHLIATHPEFRGKGVGRALMDAAIDLADNWLQVSRLGLSVWTTNTTAISLYESHGFTVEGTMRRYVYRNGEYLDAHVMSRIQTV